MSFPQSVLQSFLALYGFGVRTSSRGGRHRNRPVLIGRQPSSRF